MQRALFDVPGGKGYVILNDAGKEMIRQPFRPGSGGMVPMTEQEASALADAILVAPSMTVSRSRAEVGQPVFFAVDIGPESYTGAIQWYENGALLGEVVADNRRAVLEYAPDAEGTVTIRAGNDTYGWAEVMLEVRA